MDPRTLYSQIGKYRAAKRRRVEGTCAVCGTAFEGTTKRQFCSAACNQRAFRARHREKRAQDNKPATGDQRGGA